MEHQTEERLDMHGQLIEDLNRRTRQIAQIVYGDDEAEFKGLVERMRVQEEQTREISAWRKEMTIRWETTLLLIRVGLVVMGITGAGVWLPILSQIIDIIP